MPGVQNDSYCEAAKIVQYILLKNITKKNMASNPDSKLHILKYFLFYYSPPPAPMHVYIKQRRKERI
jgi:hypothetical protein